VRQGGYLLELWLHNLGKYTGLFDGRGGGGGYRERSCSDCLIIVFSFPFEGDNWQIHGDGRAKFCMEIERKYCCKLCVMVQLMHLFVVKH
jgi:hypothetical protein